MRTDALTKSDSYAMFATPSTSPTTPTRGEHQIWSEGSRIKHRPLSYRWPIWRDIEHEKGQSSPSASSSKPPTDPLVLSAEPPGLAVRGLLFLLEVSLKQPRAERPGP